MSSMISVSDELMNKICFQFRAVIEEFGSRNVVIALPRIWKSLAESHMFANIQAEFCTENHIVIRASHDNGNVEFCHKVI